MKICECKKDMKFNPKGVGKTKESFWGCSDYPRCKNTANPTQEEIKKYELQARIDALDSEYIKFKTIARMNATNSAIEICKPLGMEEELAPLRAIIKKWTKWFYKGHMEWWMKNIINEED